MPMVCKVLGFITLLSIVQLSASSQSKDITIVVIGSSTAEGAGTSSMDSSWVNRLRKSTRVNLSDGADTIIYNLAKGGTTTYVGRENGYVVPSGYAGPDPERNITKALSLNPDIILVNYPSNDVANNMSTQTTMDNYMVYNSMSSANAKKIFFLTSQPRNSVSYDQQLQLRSQKDQIRNTFETRAINVWDILVAADGLSINTYVSSGDGTHVNDNGHRLIHQQVVNSLAAMALPVKLSRFDAEAKEKNIELTWETSSEQNNSHFVIERSTNTREFLAVGKIKGHGNSSVKLKYHFSDRPTVEGKFYYRLKQVDLDGKFTYSGIVAATVKTAAESMAVFPVPASNTIHLKLKADRKEQIQVSICDRVGNKISSYSRNADKGENNYSFPLTSLSTGNYMMQIKRENSVTKRVFIKL